MLASVAFVESAQLLVSVRCVNRMGLGNVSTSVIELDTALRHPGELCCFHEKGAPRIIKGSWRIIRGNKIIWSFGIVAFGDQGFKGQGPALETPDRSLKEKARAFNRGHHTKLS